MYQSLQALSARVDIIPLFLDRPVDLHLDDGDIETSPSPPAADGMPDWRRAVGCWGLLAGLAPGAPCFCWSPQQRPPDAHMLKFRFPSDRLLKFLALQLLIVPLLHLGHADSWATRHAATYQRSRDHSGFCPLATGLFYQFFCMSSCGLDCFLVFSFDE